MPSPMLVTHHDASIHRKLSPILGGAMASTIRLTAVERYLSALAVFGWDCLLSLTCVD